MFSLYKQSDPLASSLAQICMGAVSGLYSHCLFTPPLPPPNSLPGLVQGKGGHDGYFYDRYWCPEEAPPQAWKEEPKPSPLACDPFPYPPPHLEFLVFFYPDLFGHATSWWVL